MITDFRKALKLLDVIYTSDNDSIRESYNRLAVLASLDQTTGAFGPFESFYNDFQNIKWQIDEVRSKLYTLEQFQRDPATNYIYNTWLNNQIDARTTNNVTEHYLVKELQNKITVLENEIKKLTQEKDEQEPNSNTE